MENCRGRIITAACFSAVTGAVSFIWDRAVFTFPQKQEESYQTALTDYCICKILAVIVLFVLFYGLLTLIFSRDEAGCRLIEVLKCGALYLPVMIAALIIKLPAGFVTNDEYSILNDATHLIHDTWFNIMTVYYYIVSLMLIPHRYGPIFMKVIIEFFVVGVTVHRTKEYFGKRIGMLMYVLFLLYPVIAYTTSAHRLPVYFLIYLAVFVKLLYDRLEKKSIGFLQTFLILFAMAVLSQWRTEGIYLFVLAPLLMFMVYPQFRNIKNALILLGVFFALEGLLWIPQNGAVSSNLDGAANDRMKPFWAYTITNMYRNGLDKEKNAADLAEVDRYISLEAIEKINEHYGDINYEDVLILYEPGFAGVREGAGDAEFIGYSEALKRIFKNNPDVFIKTRWGAFCYSALPFHITFSDFSAKGLVSFAISIVKTVSYNLFIPVGFAFCACIYSLVRRKWYSFFVFGGLMSHFFIVFILAPASYFKYYFPVYILSYFYIIALAVAVIAGRKEKKAYTVI